MDDIKVTIDTSSAEKVVENLTTRLEKLQKKIEEANKAGQDTSKLTEEYNNVSEAVEKLSSSLDKEKSVVDETSVSTDNLTKSTENLDDSLGSAGDALGGVSKLLGVFGKEGAAVGAILGKLKNVTEGLRKATKNYQTSQDQANASTKATGSSMSSLGNAATGATTKVNFFSRALAGLTKAAPWLAAIALAFKGISTVIAAASEKEQKATDIWLEGLSHIAEVEEKAMNRARKGREDRITDMVREQKSQEEITRQRLADLEEERVENERLYGYVEKQLKETTKARLALANAGAKSDEDKQRLKDLMSLESQYADKLVELKSAQTNLNLTQKEYNDLLANLPLEKAIKEGELYLKNKQLTTKWVEDVEISVIEKRYELEIQKAQQAGEDVVLLEQQKQYEIDAITKKYEDMRKREALKNAVDRAQAEVNSTLQVSRNAMQQELDLEKARYNQKIYEARKNEEDTTAITEEYETAKLKIRAKYAQAAVDAARALYESEAATHSNYVMKELEEYTNRQKNLDDIHQTELTSYKDMLDNKLIAVEDYNEKVRTLNFNYEEETLALETQWREAENERWSTNLDNRLTTYEGYINETFALQQENLQHQYDEEIRMAELTGADKQAIEEKYARLNANLEKQKYADQVSRAIAVGTQITSVMGSMFEDNKKMQGATIILNSIMGAAGGLAQAIATYPAPYGPILGAATAAAELASGMASYRKLMATTRDSSSTGSTPSADVNVQEPQQVGAGVNAEIGTGLVLSEAQSNLGVGSELQTVVVVDQITAAQMEQNTINNVAVI